MAEKYRLLSGGHSRRGADNALVFFQPGDVLELSEAEVAAFGDKFELVKSSRSSKKPSSTSPPAISRLSVSAVIKQIDAGSFTAKAALKAETSRKKPRPSLIKKLEALLE